MKKILFALVLAAFGLTSCEEITDAINSVKVPAEAKPSKTFTLALFAPETNADAVHRFTTSQSSAPFTSIEFFGDGYFLMSNDKTARANVDELYGKYAMDGNLHYTLDNGDAIDASGLNGAHGTISYTPKGGESISVSVTSDQPLTSEASKTLCRTWRLNTSKYWLSVKGLMAIYRGYSMENGVFKHEDNKVADFIGEFYDGDLMTADRWPEQVTLSPFGTYYVRFASGKTLIQEWAWSNESKGTIRTKSDAQFSITDFLKSKDVTVRFVDNSLRLYTEYDIQATRVQNVNAFSTAQ